MGRLRGNCCWYSGGGNFVMIIDQSVLELVALAIGGTAMGIKLSSKKSEGIEGRVSEDSEKMPARVKELHDWHNIADNEGRKLWYAGARDKEIFKTLKEILAEVKKK